MNRIPQAAKFRSLLVSLVIILVTSGGFSQSTTSPLPSPTGPVNDYAGVIEEQTKAQLNAKLIEFKKSTGIELAVVVVRTTGDQPIFDYSLAVARGWGIGSKEADNPSALLFVAIDDRKYFTQVSRDLEDELPDGLVGNLQRQYLVPEFRKGNYAKGISDTIDAYIRTIEQRRSGVAAPATTPDASGPSGGTTRGSFSFLCCLLIIGVLILIVISRSRGASGKGGGRWGGGGFGGGAGALPWVIGSILSSGGGSSGSSSSDWGGGGGGGWGGFGGGGDFGGGGAGGDW